MTAFDQSRGDVFERLRLTRIINASGTETTMGASPVCPEVRRAVDTLVPHSVNMLELQSAACRTIARAYGCEAGLVAHCSAAGIVIAVAACMTGKDLALAERLPDAAGLKDEVILQRGHNITYGGYVTQNIAITGAKVVEIGAATECGAYQLRAAITPNTAAILHVVSHHTVQSGMIDLETVSAIAGESGVPVIVDAAAEPDPRRFLKAGADLVITSMHKTFASITGATVAGRLDLVQACLFQEKGIGRPMKAGKEAVIGAMVAVERWEALDFQQTNAALEKRLDRAKATIESIAGLRVETEIDATSRLFSRLLVHVDPETAGISAHQLSAGLAALTPSITVRTLMADIGLLQIDLRRADEKTTDHIAQAIVSVVAGGEAGGAVPADINLADKALDALERFPLPVREAI